MEEYRSPFAYMRGLCEGFRREIKLEQNKNSTINQNRKQLRRVLNRDFQAELTCVQSYQGLLAKLFEVE